MSSKTVVAKRYAKALFEVASDKGIVDAVKDDLRAVVAAVQADKSFEQLLMHPNISSEEKLGVLNKAFEGKVQETVLSVLHILVKNGREALLNELLSYYLEVANQATGSAEAVVTTPAALSEADAQAVAAQFSQLTGKQIRVANVVDPALLGGMTVRIGDRLYDGSLSGKLARLEKSLNAVKA